MSCLIWQPQWLAVGVFAGAHVRWWEDARHAWKLISKCDKEGDMHSALRLCIRIAYWAGFTYSGQMNGMSQMIVQHVLAVEGTFIRTNERNFLNGCGLFTLIYYPCVMWSRFCERWGSTMWPRTASLELDMISYSGFLADILLKAKLKSIRDSGYLAVWNDKSGSIIL